MGTKRKDIDFMLVSDEGATFEGFTRKIGDYVLKGIENSYIEKVTEPYYDNQGLGVLVHTGSVKIGIKDSSAKLELFSVDNWKCDEKIAHDKGSVTQGGKKPNDFCVLYEYIPK